MSQVKNAGLSYLETVEEYFQAARGTGFFRLSPLDWGLVEAWHQTGIPIEAVLRGIDQTFENRRRRPVQGRIEKVNSISYCAQAIAIEVQAMANNSPMRGGATAPPFDTEAVRSFVARNATALKEKGYSDLAASLEALDEGSLFSDLEQLERQLTAIEVELFTRLLASIDDGTSTKMRQELDRDMKPYRSRMTSEQLAMLEKQFLERRLLESAGLSRLSLFYL